MTAPVQSCQQMNAGLLPCPFCGNSDIMEGVYYADGEPKRGAVRCADCGVRAPMAAWNKRTPSGDVRAAVIEELEKIAGVREYSPEDHEAAARYKREQGLWTTDEYLADVALAALSQAPATDGGQS